MVGESNREFQYPKPAEAALDDVMRAFTVIGKVVDVSNLTKTITGKVRYGLQSVKLRVSVVDQGEGQSVVRVQAFGDDIWGGGARKGTDKLVRALESGDRPPGALDA